MGNTNGPPLLAAWIGLHSLKIRTQKETSSRSAHDPEQPSLGLPTNLMGEGVLGKEILIRIITSNGLGEQL